MTHYVKDMKAGGKWNGMTSKSLLKAELLYLSSNPLFKEEPRKIQVDIMEQLILTFAEWHTITKEDMADIYSTLKGIDALTEQ